MQISFLNHSTNRRLIQLSDKGLIGWFDRGLSDVRRNQSHLIWERSLKSHIMCP